MNGVSFERIEYPDLLERNSEQRSHVRKGKWRTLLTDNTNYQDLERLVVELQRPDFSFRTEPSVQISEFGATEAGRNETFTVVIKNNTYDTIRIRASNGLYLQQMSIWSIRHFQASFLRFSGEALSVDHVYLFEIHNQCRSFRREHWLLRRCRDGRDQ
ncbi:B-block binding subunit of TFIIIC [Striga asiatica]|uniref:B-block binding subunit of TFIIIC n=1 Tax=Striga asiatica TaxID=4170 RepID=A0A5A7Q8Q8_STRAF|nr:B-block binding subunit of TFIIIC [Striga asiatica]